MESAMSKSNPSDRDLLQPLSDAHSFLPGKRKEINTGNNNASSLGNISGLQQILFLIYLVKSGGLNARTVAFSRQSLINSVIASQTT
jgi:hypothetical protein